MNVKDRIKKEIKIQKSIEGEECQDELLLKFLEAVTMSNQWAAFVNVKFHSYGKLSYECHRFYYPKKELLDFIALMEGETRV